MSESSRVDRNRGPEPTGPRKKKGVDSEAFKEMMKVGKVRETDPEEQKKAKQQFEVEEEFKAQQTSSGPLQQGLNATEPSLFDAAREAEGRGVGSNLSPSSSEGTPPPPSVPPPFFPHSSDEGEQLQVEGSSTAGQQKTTETKQTPPPSKKKKEADKRDQKKDEMVVVPKEPGPLQPMAGTSIAEEPKTIETSKKQSPEGLFAQLEKTPEEKEKKTAEQFPIPEEAPLLPQGSWESTKEVTKKEEKIRGIPKGEGLQPELQLEMEGAATPTNEAAPSGPITSPFANLPPQIQALFERMVGVMTVMHTGGIKETTINLTSPQFKNSLFFGTQIVLTEYSTAPKQFNIELIGNQQAMHLASANTNELLAAFEAGNYTFKVHRIDTSIEPSRAATKKIAQRVKRKKAGGG